MIVSGVCGSGKRDVLGFYIVECNDETFWVQLLRQLKSRGLKGVQLVTSDAQEGLKNAIDQILTGASWQWCRSCFMLDLLAHFPKADRSLIAHEVYTIFTQPDRQAASERLSEVVRILDQRWLESARLLSQAEDDILCYMAFPEQHWRRIYSTHPRKRLNKEVTRCTKIVETFPDQHSVTRLVGKLLIDIDGDWQVARPYFSEASMNNLTQWFRAI